MILLSDATVILHKAGSCMGLEDNRTNFALSAAAYSIDDFNANV